MIRTLTIAAAFALSGAAAQADGIDQTFNVDIDGTCTSLFLHVQNELVAGTRGNYCTASQGAPLQVIEGGVVATVDGDTGVVVSETDNGKVFTWLFESPVNGAGNVFVVSSDGKSSRRSARGTYHIVHKKPHGELRSGPDFMDQFRQ